MQIPNVTKKIQCIRYHIFHISSFAWGPSHLLYEVHNLWKWILNTTKACSAFNTSEMSDADRKLLAALILSPNEATEDSLLWGRDKGMVEENRDPPQHTVAWIPWDKMYKLHSDVLTFGGGLFEYQFEECLWGAQTNATKEHRYSVYYLHFLHWFILMLRYWAIWMNPMY